MMYLFWAILLITQNMAFTWVSRARNSGSLGYHATAAVFSNGIWFVSQFLLIGMVMRPGQPFWYDVALGVEYITCTVVGSVLMHHISMKFLETGRRKVGAAHG